jgi:hypothetical protein
MYAHFIDHDASESFMHIVHPSVCCPFLYFCLHDVTNMLSIQSQL